MRWVAFRVQWNNQLALNMFVCHVRFPDQMQSPFFETQKLNGLLGDDVPTCEGSGCHDGVQL